MMTDLQRAIVDALAYEPMTINDLAKCCRMSTETVRCVLIQLQANRHVRAMDERMPSARGAPQRVYRLLTSWERAA